MARASTGVWGTGTFVAGRFQSRTDRRKRQSQAPSFPDVWGCPVTGFCSVTRAPDFVWRQGRYCTAWRLSARSLSSNTLIMFRVPVRRCAGDTSKAHKKRFRGSTTSTNIARCLTVMSADALALLLVRVALSV